MKNSLAKQLDERLKCLKSFWPMDEQSKGRLHQTYPARDATSNDFVDTARMFMMSTPSSGKSWFDKKLMEEYSKEKHKAFYQGNWDSQQSTEEKELHHGGPDHIHYNAMEILESKRNYKMLIVVDFQPDLRKFIELCSNGYRECQITNDEHIFFPSSNNTISFINSHNARGVHPDNVHRIMFIRITDEDRNEIYAHFNHNHKPTKEINMNQIVAITEKEAENQIMETIKKTIPKLQLGALNEIAVENERLKIAYKDLETDIKEVRERRNELSEEVEKLTTDRFNLQRELGNSTRTEQILEKKENELNKREKEMDHKFQLKEQNINSLKETVKLLKNVVNRITNPQKSGEVE